MEVFILARGLLTNTSKNPALGLNMFTDDELFEVHLATLDVLWNVGIKCESKEAREIFAGAGCLVDEATHIVKIPAWLVGDSMRVAPPNFRCTGRDPKKDWYCESGRTGFVNFGEALNVIDPYTRKRRPPTKDDLYSSVTMIDHMDNIVVFERNIVPADVDPYVGQLHVLNAFLNNTTKPGYIGMHDPNNIKVAFKMGSVVAGSEEKFKERPFFGTSTDPISPLVQAQGATDALIYATRLGIPVKINPLGMAGGTTCVHLAGTMVTHNAEVVSMFVLGQLIKRGVPMVYGSSTAMMDLSTTVSCVGSPELALFSAFVAKMAQFYKVPSWVAGG